MAKRDDIKAKLRLAALQARKYATERQLDEAAADLERRSFVRKEDLETLGEKVANDRQIFASTDTDDMNNLLGRLGEK
jgi:hypothetical protein